MQAVEESIHHPRRVVNRGRERLRLVGAPDILMPKRSNLAPPFITARGAGNDFRIAPTRPWGPPIVWSRHLRRLSPPQSTSNATAPPGALDAAMQRRLR